MPEGDRSQGGQSGNDPVYFNNVFDLVREEIAPEEIATALILGMQLAELVGEPVKLMSWLTTANAGFSGVRPIELMKTPEGREEVNNMFYVLAEGGLF